MSKARNLGFNRELCDLINKHSIDSECNLPDWVVTDFLSDCLDGFINAQYNANGCEHHKLWKQKKDATLGE